MTYDYIQKIIREALSSVRVIRVCMKAGEQIQGRAQEVEFSGRGNIGLQIEEGWSMAGTKGPSNWMRPMQGFFFNACDVSSITLGRVCDEGDDR